MNTQLYRQVLDSIDNENDVFAVHRGEVVSGRVESFQTEPPIFTLRIPAGTITTQQVFFTRPEKSIPERGRLVKHKATGTYIRSSGEINPDGKLVDDQGQAWEDDAWVDEDLERRRAEEEARRLAEEEERRKREEADAAAKAKQEEINQRRAESEPEPEAE